MSFIIERCSKCNAILPPDHGFSSVCEACEPLPDLNFIGGVAIVKPKETPKPPKNDKNLLLTGKKKKSVVKKDIPYNNTFEAAIDLEQATPDEIIDYKILVDNRLAEIKLLLLNKYPYGDELLAKLRKEQIELGRISQITARHLKKSKDKGRTDRHIINMLAETEKNKHFFKQFYDVTKTIVSPEIFEIINNEANRRMREIEQQASLLEHQLTSQAK